jgi:uncharacterized protein
MSRLLRVENTTKHRVLAEQGELADNPWRRLKGLLGRPGLRSGEALVIRPCQGVHSWFMAFPIDVLYVDAHSVICRLLAEMPPNRFGPMVWQARSVIELPAGSVRASGTEVGDRLAISSERP